MAYRVGTKVTATDGTTTGSFVPDLPTETQIDDDVMVLWVLNDAGTSALATPSGWTAKYASAAAVSGTRAAVFWKKRSGSDITAPTLTGSTEDWIVVAELIRDADTTDPWDVFSYTEQTSNTQTPTAPTATTTTANALVRRVLLMDSGGASDPAVGYGSFTDVARKTDTGTLEAYVAEDVQHTAGSVGTFVWSRNLNDGGVLITAAFKNKTDGGVPPKISGAPTVISQLADIAAGPTFLDIQGIRTTLLSATVLVLGAGPTASQGATYTNDPDWYGCWNIVTCTPPASTGPFGFYWAVTADFSAGHPFALTLAQPWTAGLSYDGASVYFEDNAGNWRLWRPAKALVAGNSLFRAYTADLPNETFVDTSGGAISWANIVRVGVVLVNTTASATARAVNLRGLYTTNPVVLTGGTAARPATPSDIANSIKSGTGIYRGKLQGSGQALSTQSIQIGNGTTATYFKAAGQSLEYEISDYLPWFKLGSGDLEFRIKAGASDTMDFRGALIATTTAHALAIDSGSSGSATYLWQGATFTGWDVTWKDDIDVDGASFLRCGEINAQNAQFDRCLIAQTRSTDAAIAFDANSSMTGTTIDVTGTSAAYHLELGSAVLAFSLTDVTFTGTPGTDKVHVKRGSNTVAATACTAGLRYEIKTVGTTDFTLIGASDNNVGTQFVATGAGTGDGDTYEVVVITIDGTTTLVAGDVTSDGAVVAILPPATDATGTMDGALTGSKFQVYNETTDAEIDIDTGTSWTWTYTNGVDGVSTNDIIRLRVTKLGYLPYEARAIASDTGFSFYVAQEADDIYVENDVDGSSVTGFSADYVNLQIDRTTASDFTILQVYAWFQYNLTTDDGIRYFFGGLTALDAGNYRINNDDVDLTLNNGTATNLKTTDVCRFFRVDKTYPVESSGGGGIDINWQVPVLTAETGGGVGGLTAEQQAQLASASRAAGLIPALL